MADIFISYARADAARVERLVRVLESRWSVFWDRTIPPGQTWDNYIGKQLEDSRCVIVIWSTTAVGSEWVREEAHHGRSRGALVPVLFDKVSPPFGFRQVQAADLTTWDGVPSGHGIELLMKTLDELLPANPAEQPQVSTAVSVPPEPMRAGAPPTPPGPARPQSHEPIAPPKEPSRTSEHSLQTPTRSAPPATASEPTESRPPQDSAKRVTPVATPRVAPDPSPPLQTARDAYRPRSFDTEIPVGPAPSFLRSRMALAAGGVLLVIAIAIGIWAMTAYPDYDSFSVRNGDGYTDLVHAGRVQAVAFSADGRTLAAGIDLSGVRIWHLDDLEREPTLLDDGSETDVAFHPRQPLLATVRGEVLLRRLDDLETTATLPGDTGANSGVAFSADGTLVAGVGGGVVGVWRLGDGTATELLSSRKGNGNSRYGVALSPDGSWLAADSESDKGMVDVWMTSAIDEDPHVLGTSGAAVWDVAISRDGKLIAAASDAGLYVWESIEAEPRVLSQNSIWSVAFSPDGQVMAAGDSGGQITLWRLSDMTAMSTLVLDDRVDSLAFSPDGRTLAAGSFKGTVRLWPLP